MRNLNELNHYRRSDLELRLGGLGGAKGGVFVVPFENVELRVIASSDKNWDHVSVSLETRCPTWSEMEAVRKLFSKSHEVWFQLGMPESDHISFHPFCLHWWRHHFRELKLPPAEMVGPKVNWSKPGV